MNAEFILKVLNIKECNERKYILSHEHQCHLVTHNSVSMFLLLPPRNAVLVFQYTHPALRPQKYITIFLTTCHYWQSLQNCNTATVSNETRAKFPCQKNAWHQLLPVVKKQIKWKRKPKRKKERKKTCNNEMQTEKQTGQVNVGQVRNRSRTHSPQSLP
jgi:hypothetical protein